MSSELLFGAIAEGYTTVVDYPSFGKAWDNAAKAYNEFVEELGLNDEYVAKLQKVIDYNCELEKIGYCHEIQDKINRSGMTPLKMKLLFHCIELDPTDQRRVLGFVKGLIDGKKGR